MEENGGAAGGLSFGGLGFGTAKPAATGQPKNIFGAATTGSVFGQTAAKQEVKSPFGAPAAGSLFGQAAANQEPKSPFGAATGSPGLVKNPTFSAQSNAGTGLFGATATTQPATTATSSPGGLFSSFKTPQKSGMIYFLEFSLYINDLVLII